VIEAFVRALDGHASVADTVAALRTFAGTRSSGR
jgi:hypothetical protein